MKKLVNLAGLFRKRKKDNTLKVNQIETTTNKPNKRLIDISTWKRREHFEFFNEFDEPLFGITMKVDCTIAYQKAKSLGYPFSLYYLYLSLKVINETEEFRYRIEDNKLYCYDVVGAGPTIFRADETFGYGYYPYHNNIKEFIACAQRENERVKSVEGLALIHTDEDVIHYSTLPWADFTAVNHARKWNAARSVPKITFGKMIRENDKIWLPVDVHVNHALMDGFHVGRFFEQFQNLLNEF